MASSAKRERHEDSRRTPAHLLLLVVTLLTLSACFTIPRDRVYRWEEEVVLSTGERLLVDRTLRFESGSAPFNPLKTSWAERESTITVRDGPNDLKGARYENPFVPMVLDRDPATGDLVVIGTLIFCGDAAALKLPKDQLYAAWTLRPNERMQLITVPEWAWGRYRNLLNPNYEGSPPRHVGPEYAAQQNRKDEREFGRRYFYVERHTNRSC